jgi:TPR repeat protein
MIQSVLAFLERIRSAFRENQEPDWFTRGVAAYEEQRYLKALEAWKQASTKGDREADYRVGLLYARGEGVVVNVPEAVTWYRRAAAAGHTEAQFQLGLIYMQGSHAGASGLDRWFDVASQQNSELARRTLKMLFPHGIAVEKDLDEARRWIWSAGTAGKVEAQAVLGELYRHGLGVTQDYQEALRWYWFAAQQGIAAAQFGMGDLYYQGLGVAVDYCLAADWYERAARSGDARAQVALASMCRAGQGKTADLKEAGLLFVQAAEQGEARGLYHAALMHLKGEGLPKNIDKAETYLRKSAKQNYLPAIISLAQFYARGNGIEPDLREAAVWYLKAAALGDVQSQFIIGRLYATGSGVPSNLRESAKWFLRAAEQGNPIAAHNVATYYAKGTGVERDVLKAIEWYQAAADAGLAASQVQLGKMYAVGDGVPRDRKLATSWLEKAVQGGDPEAKTALAMLHLHEAAWDPSRAEALLKQAAEGGHAAAAMELGHLYSGRYAVEAKSNDAVLWYTKAAEGGATEAQHTLGMLYLNGRGVQKNLSAAAHWIEKAAQGAHAASQFQLAVLYCKGQGVPRDLAQAVTWYEQAAERGHALAQYNLAVMVSKGQGCEVHESRAASWFEKAAEQGVSQAEGALADLRRAGRYRPSDDNATVRSLSRNQEPVPHPSTTQRRADLATADPLRHPNQGTANEVLPHHSWGTSATTSAGGGRQMDDPSKHSSALPQGAAPSSHTQSGSESPAVKSDDDRPQNHDRAAAPDVGSLIAVPSRDASGRSEAGQETSNSAVPLIAQSVRSKPNPTTDQPQTGPIAAPPMPNSSQVGRSAQKSEDHTDTSRAASKQFVDRVARPHRIVERETPQSNENPDPLELGSWSPGCAVVAPTDEADAGGLEMQMPAATHPYARPTTGTPDATTLAGRSGLNATTDALRQAIAPSSLDEVEETSREPSPQRPSVRGAAPELMDLTRAPQNVDGVTHWGEGNQDAEATSKASSWLREPGPSEQTERHSLDKILPDQLIEIPVISEPDCVGSQKFSPQKLQHMLDLGRRSTHDEVCAGTASGRHDLKDPDAVGQAMFEIGEALQMPERADGETARGLMRDQLETDPADYHQNRRGQTVSNETNLHDRLTTAGVPASSVGARATNDDGVFKDLARAMAELVIVSPKSERSLNALRDHPPGAPYTVGPNSEQKGHKWTDLSASAQAHDIPSELANGSLAEPDTTAPKSPTADFDRQKPMVNAADDGSGSRVDQIAPHKTSSTDAKPSAKLNQTLGALRADPTVSLSTINPPPIRRTGEEISMTKPERKSTTTGHTASGLCNPPTGRVTSSPKTSLDSLRSRVHPKSSATLDQFLVDLTRQLDDVELLSRRPPTQRT